MSHETEPAPRPSCRASLAADLHRCETCGCRFMQPLSWVPIASGRWALELECPNCRELRLGVFDEATIERLDEELDRGMEELVADLVALRRATMETDVERLVTALRHDGIVPEDF